MLILLLNAGAYNLVISFFATRAAQKLEAKIDQQDYDEASLVEITVDLNMPYQERYTEFERHYGQINIEGKSYTYVKKKIQGDVVIFKCIANKSAQSLKELKNHLAKANSNGESNSPAKPTSSFAKIVLSEFVADHDFNSPAPFKTQTGKSFTFFSFHIPNSENNTPDQPPESARQYLS